MQLSRIIINENADHQYIFLREVGGSRSFAIVIGVFEATSIDRRVKGNRSPRPLTHDLIANIVEKLGGEIVEVHITELKDATYFAKIKIDRDGESVEIDSRPSDAIALAVTVNAPIFVAEDVLEELDS
jgi:bifunctional DNase/RNase